jgi:hypothetical protein
MAVLAKLDVAFATEHRVAALGSAAARLMRADATQVEILRRLRNGAFARSRMSPSVTVVNSLNRGSCSITQREQRPLYSREPRPPTHRLSKIP